MRDAFGGAFSLKLMLIFLMIYIFFVCIALNYAKAFRVKNRIINIIEQNEVFDANGQTGNAIDSYLNQASYIINYPDVKKVSSCSELYGRGYCVVPKDSAGKTYYLVETYMIFNIPILNIKFPIAIKGETRVVEKMATTSGSQKNQNDNDNNNLVSGGIERVPDATLQPIGPTTSTY